VAFFFCIGDTFMGSAAVETIRASASIEPAQPSRGRLFRILDIDQHKAWREFQHWWECRAAGAVPARTRYSDNPRQSQLRPCIEDRYVWSIDMSRSFAQLSPNHRAVLELLAQGESLAIRAHQMGTSIRTLLRRRDAALIQLAAIRSRYAEEA
jgi:hypothetical protein